MDAWVEVTNRGRRYRLSYDELAHGGARLQKTVPRDSTKPAAHFGMYMCNPEHPVPMHLRRVRIRPPSYA